MIHISIFFEILALIIGSAAILYVYQHYRNYRCSFIKPYILYILIGNLITLRNLFFLYLTENFYQTGHIEDIIPLISIHILSSFALIGLIYYRLKITILLREKPFPRVLYKTFIMLCIIISIIFLKEILFPYHTGQVIDLYYNGSEYGIRLLTRYIVYIEFALTLLTWLELALNAGFKNNQDKRKAIILFSSFYLIIFPISFFPFFSQLSHYIIMIPIHSVLRNIVPFIWLRFFFVKYYLGGQVFHDKKEILPAFAETHSITGREEEIIGLIIQGKSNKEIMNILDLSLNTVRNHIYHIYRKLGINSRTQLFKLILEYSEKNKPDNS